MNKEIKEILNNFEKYEARYRLRNETQFIITHREIQILLDYIINLQEENTKLRIQISAREEIINKAIEYINEATNSDSYTILPSGKHTDISYCIVAFEDLLNILGDNNER